MFKVSCVQFTSGKDIKENLKKILNIIHECIKEKSDLIITPENTSIMSSDKKELLSKLNVMEDDIFLKEFKRVSTNLFLCVITNFGFTLSGILHRLAHKPSFFCENNYFF